MSYQEMGEMDEKTILIAERNGYILHTSSSEYESAGLKKKSTSGDYDVQDSVDREKSWWFHFCMKLREKEVGPGWEPPNWQSVCPYPFCPTYRHVARVISLFLLGLGIWGVVYCVIGKDVAPGGQLFHMVFLVVAAHFGGWLFRMFNLPELIGMILVGISFQNFGLINIHRQHVQLTCNLRKTALVVILTRAGLDLNPEDMKKLIFTVLRLGLIPWCVESAFIVFFSHYILKLPWMWAVLLGSSFGAVSPAVVVPCLVRLRSKGYGVAKGISTLVIAVSGINDAASVAAFGIVYSIMFHKYSLTYSILLGPLSVLTGFGFGIFWALLLKYIPEKGDSFAVPLRVLMLLCGGLLVIFGSEELGLGGAGPLGAITAAFGCSWAWYMQGWKVDDNPVVTVFSILWMVFEPVLFSLTGTLVIIDEIDPNMFTISLFGLIAAVVLRIFITILLAVKTSLNYKERLCCALCWMSKASVQAALAPIALETVHSYADSKPEKHYAHLILMICVMTIIITAPLGAIIMTFLGPHLLTKTVPESPSFLGRKSTISLRDISIK